MHQIIDSKELSALFMNSVPVTLTLCDQFVLILRDSNRTTIWKNLRSILTAESFPNELVWPDGIPAVKGITILVDEKGKAEALIRSYKLLLRLQLGKEQEQLWIVGDDKVEQANQLFLAYESVKTMTVETVVIIEGDGKKANSSGSLSFNKDAKKALNTYVKVIKALMGLSGIRLAPMLDGDSPPQLPIGDGMAGAENG